jgi:hypothetical protein
MARIARVAQRWKHPVGNEDRRPRDYSPRQRRSFHSTFFLPGATIPESGIYEVLHEGAHRETHESVLVKGDRFPACDICDSRVRFRVVRTAPYIFEDEDFVE